MIEHEIRKYEHFVNTLMTIGARYCSHYPELLNRIAELRATKVKNPATSVVSVYDDPLEDIGAKQLSTTAWRQVAKHLHPDRGGDPLLFRLAHALYKSNDYHGLQMLLLSIESNDLTKFKECMVKKVNSLYEVQKARPYYMILLADFNKQYDLAHQLTKKYLLKSIENLEKL